MKHLFVINPNAGKGRTLQYIPRIKELFTLNGQDYIIEITKKPGHATELVRSYTEKEDMRVYSIGGDGTLNEILNGIIGTNSSLAIIPSGSGNDFIRSINENSGIDDMLIKSVEGREELIDVGKINGKYFVNVSSVGIDAEIAHNAQRLKKIPLIPSKFSYLLSIFITVFKYKSKNLTINLHDQQINVKTLLLAIANGKFYGGGMAIAPFAKINDGIFDVCHVRDASILKILRLFPRVIKGTHESIEEVSFYKTNKLHVYAEYDIAFNIDGEIVKMKEARFEIIPKGVKVVIPNLK